MPNLKQPHDAPVQGHYGVVYETRRYTLPGLGRVTVQRDEAGTQCYDEGGTAIATPAYITAILAIAPLAAPVYGKQ